MRAPLRPFAYARNPVCRVACTLYALNRWCLPLAYKPAFFRNYFSDLLLIPAALPLMLWLERRLGLRSSDRSPAWSEVLMHLVIWSVAAEVIGPRLFPGATADPRDVLAYAAGAAGAMLAWVWV